jgi:membrane-bound lytic murein transglycosylase D
MIGFRSVILLVFACGCLFGQASPLEQIKNHPRVREAERLFALGQKSISEEKPDEARKHFDDAMLYLLATPMDDPARLVLDRYIQDLAERIYLIDLDDLGAARQFDEIRFDKSPLDEIRELTFPLDPALKSKVQQDLLSTQSQLPLVLNDTVLSFLNYFAYGRGRSTLEAALRRSGKYRPMIFRILAEERVPPELIYLAQAESGFLPRAVSYKSAVGMWQFIRETGRQYGLVQTPFTDDRLDPERATRAAARHLRDLYEALGDWHLALAAYNCGSGCVDRAVQKTAYADFWELRSRHAVPIETTNYVPIIVALTIIMKNPERYGLENFQMEEPMEYDTIEVYSATSLQLAADAAGVALPALEELNPAVLRRIVPAGYFLRVPKGLGQVASQRMNLVPAAKRDSWRLYSAQPGEDAAAIARRYQVSSAALAEANANLEDTLAAGGYLAIPQAAPRLPAPKRVTPSRAKAPVRRSTANPSRAKAPAKKAPAKTASAKKSAKKTTKR